MKFGDKKKIRTDHIVSDQKVAKRGDEVEFQDNVRHTMDGIKYHFKTESGKEIWLKENQFKK